jgi:hypothetical protein
MVMHRLIAEQIFRNKEPVYIKYNRRLGTWMYSIVPVSDPEFWLDSFLTEWAAKKFCEHNQLPLEGLLTHEIKKVS